MKGDSGEREGGGVSPLEVTKSFISSHWEIKQVGFQKGTAPGAPREWVGVWVCGEGLGLGRERERGEITFLGQ